MTFPANTSQRRQAGFSLLEAVIALAIAGIALSSLLHAAALAMRATATAAAYQQALSRARSHLDSLLDHPQPGEQDGDDGGGFRWRHHVHPAGSTAAPDSIRPAQPGEPVVTLYAVTVWITWHDATGPRTLRLDSATLCAAPPA